MGSYLLCEKLSIYAKKGGKTRGPGKKKVDLFWEYFAERGGQPHTSIFLIFFLKIVTIGG